MTALDMAMLLLTGGIAVMGFFRGFVEEILSMLAWVLAVIAVRLFLAPVTDLSSIWLGSGAAAIFSFVALFAIVFFAGKMIARRMGKGMRSSALGPVDRILGGGFGVLKGVIIATVLFLTFTLVYNVIFTVHEPRPQWMTDARSYPLLKASGDAMSRFMEERSEGTEQASRADGEGA
ncbi:MAG: CvpA family protein [Sphingobium sp.]|nr:CvpA family protein [Sphingobium sp.]